MTHSYSAVDGYATSEGTKKYVDNAINNNEILRSHFRSFEGLLLSSIGMGTYLGEPTPHDDDLVENAVYESVKSGSINVIDTAINYRLMKSEKSIGRAIDRLVNDNIISRNQVFICTKNGYITNDGDYSSIGMMEYIQKMFISPGLIDPSDISSGYHVLNPNYIARCIDKSLVNMRLNTIDLVYIHNAYEGWYADIGKTEFYESIAKVFQTYERYRSNNKIRYYGMATWTCFRVPQDSKEYLSLEDMIRIAEDIGGMNHGFRFIQLPYNLAYNEALFLKNQNVGSEKGLTILEACNRLNVGAFTSVPLFQTRLLNAKIPEYSGITDQVLKLIQIIRSTPNVTAPLLGHKNPAHVNQNIRIAKIPPLNEFEFEKALDILSQRSL
ncbi:MAG: aldo/keto reductase [Thermoproteota archaeon]|nr:aldo/keto reductase [Thermoproteota archaeon]